MKIMKLRLYYLNLEVKMINHNTKIKLGGLEVGFFISGSNPLSGISHMGKSKDKEMLKYFTFTKIKDYLKKCEECGIDAIVARIDKFMVRLFAEYWDEGGRIKWIGQTAKEYGSMKKNIEEGINAGVSAVYIHGSTVDTAFESDQIESIKHIVKEVKLYGRPIGVASHNPDNLLKIQNDDWKNDFFLMSLYNIGSNENFEDHNRIVALKTLAKLNKPCLLYKILAAGRKSLEVAMVDVKEYIRPQDGLLIGMFPQSNSCMIEENAKYLYNMRKNIF